MSPRTFRLAAIAVGVLAVLLVIWFVRGMDQRADTERAQDQDEYRAAISSLRADNQALARQVEAMGGDPVVQPPEAPGVRLVPVPGPQGDRGKRGRDGTDGAPGADAEPALPGEQGPAGPPGQDGATGRGIASMSCNDDGKWVIHYTDDTEQTVDDSSCTTP